MGRWALALCSDLGGAVTGTCQYVDNGMHAMGLTVDSNSFKVCCARLSAAAAAAAALSGRRRNPPAPAPPPPLPRDSAVAFQRSGRECALGLTGAGIDD